VKNLVWKNEYVNVKHRKGDECMKMEIYLGIMLSAVRIFRRIKHIISYYDIVYGT